VKVVLKEGILCRNIFSLYVEVVGILVLSRIYASLIYKQRYYCFLEPSDP
jgi:hypothetical protein